MLKDRKDIIKLFKKGHIVLMTPDPVYKKIKEGDIRIINYSDIVETNIHIDGDITYKVPDNWLNLDIEEFEEKWQIHHVRIKEFISNASKAMNWLAYGASTLFIIIAHIIFIPVLGFHYSFDLNQDSFLDIIIVNLESEIALIANGLAIYLKNHVLKWFIRLITWIIKQVKKIREKFSTK